MSAIRPSCSSCGSTNIVEEDICVCADCGLVVSEGILTSNTDEGTDVSYAFSSAATKRPCLNLKRGLLRVRAICRTLRLNRDIEEQSVTYFRQAYQHEKFLHGLTTTKEVLGGCSILLSCRLLNWPVSIGTIACLVDSDSMSVAGVYQDMMEIFKITAPVVNITALVEAQCSEYKLDCVAGDFAESTKALARRAEALVELAADSWIVTGRKSFFIILAAIYLAWQSLKPTPRRLKLSLNKFCQMVNVKKQPMAVMRVSEIKEVLVKLGKGIPWARQPVTADNIVELVEDILKLRPSLLQKAVRSQMATEDQEKPSQTVEPDRVEESEEDVVEVEVDTTGSDGGKRLLFAPPCLLHPKKRRVAQQRPLQEVTGDEEISDSEIDSYIRTPEECKDFAHAQKVLSEGEHR